LILLNNTYKTKETAYIKKKTYIVFIIPFKTNGVDGILNKIKKSFFSLTLE